MYRFTYWLERFKELSPAKAQTVVKTIVQLSEKTETACTTVGSLVKCETIGAFNRVKNVIFRTCGETVGSAEKKALTLFGDFLEFCEYSSFKFPEGLSPMLAEYCKSMQMAYSYKAVFIHELVSCGTTGVTIDELVNRIIGFYSDRIDHGKIAEQDDSVFSKANVSFAAAKKTILNNPLQILVDAKIIIWNKRTGIVSFTSDYAPVSNEAQNEICTICKGRLKRYYASIKPSKTKDDKGTTGCNKKLKMLLKRLESEIQGTEDNAAKKRLTTIYNSICAELGIKIKSKPKKKQTKKKNSTTKKDIPAVYTKLSIYDDRKVGALVQESLAILEKIRYKFTQEDLKNMLSVDWSKTTLKLNYAFFKLVDESKSINEQRRDHLGNGRYYSRAYTFGGKRYLVTSEWYTASKQLFIAWHNAL